MDCTQSDRRSLDQAPLVTLRVRGDLYIAWVSDGQIDGRSVTLTMSISPTDPRRSVKVASDASSCSHFCDISESCGDIALRGSRFSRSTYSFLTEIEVKG